MPFGPWMHTMLLEHLARRQLVEAPSSPTRPLFTLRGGRPINPGTISQTFHYLVRGSGTTFGRLAAELDASGRPSAHKVQDLWLAALAVQHNLQLLTANSRDFAGIPGLSVLTLASRTRR